MEKLKKQVINIINIVGDPYCVEAGDGQKIYNLIQLCFARKQHVELSFINIEILTIAFLNTAVGQLYKDFTEEFVKEYLRDSSISESGKVALKRIVDTAKRYYKNPNAMQESIDVILNK